MSFLDSQKTQSVVGIANLAQNKQINKSIQELKKSQEQAAKNAKIQADLQKEANKLERQRLSAQQDAARSAQMQLRIQEQAEQSRKLKEEQEEREKQLLKIRKQTKIRRAIEETGRVEKVSTQGCCEARTSNLEGGEGYVIGD